VAALSSKRNGTRWWTGGRASPGELSVLKLLVFPRGLPAICRPARVVRMAFRRNASIRANSRLSDRRSEYLVGPAQLVSVQIVLPVPQMSDPHCRFGQSWPLRRASSGTFAHRAAAFNTLLLTPRNSIAGAFRRNSDDLGKRRDRPLTVKAFFGRFCEIAA